MRECGNMGWECEIETRLDVMPLFLLQTILDVINAMLLLPKIASSLTPLNDFTLHTSLQQVAYHATSPASPSKIHTP